MNSLKILLTALAMLLLANGCASSDGEGEVEDYNYNEGGQNANGNGAEGDDLGEGENNYADDYANGEGVNNEEGNEFEEGDNDYDYAENVNNSDDELNLGDYDTQQENLGLQQAEGALAADGNALNTGEGLSNVVNETSDPVVDTGYSGDVAQGDSGVVRYITGSTQILDASKQGTTGSFERGDHPVIWSEGEFSRLSDGRYVSSSSLSSQGVGRARTGGLWRSGSY